MTSNLCTFELAPINQLLLAHVTNHYIYNRSIAYRCKDFFEGPCPKLTFKSLIVMGFIKINEKTNLK